MYIKIVMMILTLMMCSHAGAQSLIDYANQKMREVVQSKGLSPKHHPSVYLGIMMASSNLNPKYTESTKSELANTTGVGLFGITPSGAKAVLGAALTREQLLNPATNIRAGILMVDKAIPAKVGQIKYKHIGANKLDPLALVLYGYYGHNQFTKVTRTMAMIGAAKLALTNIKSTKKND